MQGRESEGARCSRHPLPRLDVPLRPLESVCHELVARRSGFADQLQELEHNTRLERPADQLVRRVDRHD